ncbi:hypothetical protein [Bacillus methanolicus]|uniref:Glyoxalase-like domain-containing protein n=1 Tax=Bacillus methanolicus (strain MGA3 / ATCC 53907) TaxID=796606 RepID=I3E3F6_BACMM|nr:hypothetical protein [Bacillus methanolicus]AIE58895.1 hypothetical protein BMMGA3_02125 [Bacillus methanolicus MGA3]EIJ81027.1 hypothetical protein MGA3_12080 [Bacillus methanolicus MGA3]
MLFHYHFWTPYVEETEKFYEDNGFRISQRIGKYEGDFQTFNPPLTWNDFREKNILFRIIETRKGTVNITFGYGKKIMFDHIGFLVSMEEHNKICDNAKKMNWEVKVGERRTFITTPYEFKIELQIHLDVIDTTTDIAEIEQLKMVTKMKGLENGLSILFSKPVKNISSVVGDEVTIKEAVIKGFLSSNNVDPNGVRIFDSFLVSKQLFLVELTSSFVKY